MKIGIVGLGYVGLPLSLQFIASGVKVVGLDVDAAKVEALRSGRSYIKHISNESIASAVAGGMFDPSTDFSRVADVSAVIICVPTPLNKYREPDVSYVLSTGRTIAPYLGARVRRKIGDLACAGGVLDGDGGLHLDGRLSSIGDGEPSDVPEPKLVVLESTSYPGTTEEDLRKVLEEGSGLIAGVDFHLAFSPEREDPGNPGSKVGSIPKIVGGYTPECGRRAMAVYGRAIQNLVPVSSCRAAEAAKLLENIFRSVNIALVNELKVVYEAMAIDIWEVIEAAKTKPFGFMPFYPGPGLGGHCIPIDPFYLTWKAREYGQHTRFIELAGEVNAGMTAYVVRKVTEALNQKARPVRGSRILLIGLAYKADVDDMRESPTLVLMDQLQARGAEVAYYDPWIPEVPPTREHEHWAGAKSVAWSQTAIAPFDCVVISTAHSAVDYRELAEWSDCIVDTRNAMSKVGVNGGKVVKA